MPTSQTGQVTISSSADGSGRYVIFDNSWPANGRTVMGSYESLRDAQKVFLSATDQQALDEGTPFSALSSIQAV
jgi:hypothetical protein